MNSSNKLSVEEDDEVLMRKIEKILAVNLPARKSFRDERKIMELDSNQSLKAGCGSIEEAKLIWDKYYLESHFVYFRMTLLAKMREYLELPQQPSLERVESIDEFIRASTERSSKDMPQRHMRKSSKISTTEISTLKKKISYSKRASDRASKFLQSSSLNFSVSPSSGLENSIINININPSSPNKTPPLQAEPEEITISEEVRFPKIASRLANSDVDRLSTKSNILRVDYDHNLNEKLLSFVGEGERTNRKECYPICSGRGAVMEAIYNWKLATENIMPLYWRQFVKEELNLTSGLSKDTLSLTHNFLNLAKKRNGLSAEFKKFESKCSSAIDLQLLR